MLRLLTFPENGYFLRNLASWAQGQFLRQPAWGSIPVSSGCSRESTEGSFFSSLCCKSEWAETVADKLSVRMFKGHADKRLSLLYSFL